MYKRKKRTTPRAEVCRRWVKLGTQPGKPPRGEGVVPNELLFVTNGIADRYRLVVVVVPFRRVAPVSIEFF